LETQHFFLKRRFDTEVLIETLYQKIGRKALKKKKKLCFPPDAKEVGSETYHEIEISQSAS